MAEQINGFMDTHEDEESGDGSFQTTYDWTVPELPDDDDSFVRGAAKAFDHQLRRAIKGYRDGA